MDVVGSVAKKDDEPPGNKPGEKIDKTDKPAVQKKEQDANKAQEAQPDAPDTKVKDKKTLQQKAALRRAKRKEIAAVASRTSAYRRKKTTPVGDAFYAIGFYAEYFTLQVVRLLRDASTFVAQILGFAFGGVFKQLGVFFKGVAKDTATPFVRFAKQRRAVHELRDKARKEKHKEGKQPRYVGHRIKNYATLFGNLVKVALPLVGAVALMFVVNNLFGRSYALAVEVNGAVIGYVQDETVLEEAQNILRMKINVAPNQSLADWQFAPVLTIGTTASLSNKTQIADEILRYSSEDIQEAYGVYVNGELVGVTTDGESLGNLLDMMIERYRDPTRPDAEVGFVDEVTVSGQGELYFTESIQPYTEVEQLLTSEVSAEQTHVTQAGETLGEIAYAGGITVEQLQLRNPQFEGRSDEYKPGAGEELLIKRAQPYLQVYVAYRDSEIESIPFETVEEEDSNAPLGSETVTVRGQEGQQRVYYDYVYIDGEAEPKVRLDELTEILEEPVTQVVQVGTMVVEIDPGMVSGGAFGSYSWPVPGASYSSRGFMGSAHRGLDINAPTGTPIYASNAGVVVFSGWQWSFGYHVIIEHPDGRQTLYAHCVELYVSQGQGVGGGQLIAAVGSTGNSTGPHCHFEVIEGGVRVNPYQFVNSPW